MQTRSWPGSRWPTVLTPNLPATGGTGIAGLAGLLAVCRRADRRARLGLNAESNVLLFATEGASPIAPHPRDPEASSV